MLTHSQIWSAVDALASRVGLSPSGLAKQAGLDPTSFNKSKRKTADGRERWPSTESIAKILHATDISLQDFVELIGAGHQPGFAEEAKGKPLKPTVSQSPLQEAEAMSVQLHEDHYPPLYRKGDTVIVSPSARLKSGQRILLTLNSGTIRIGTLISRTSKKVEVEILHKKKLKKIFAPQDVASIVRILWVSQ